MSYYPDLTEYSYTKENQYTNTINVGWLDKDHHFSSGEVSQEFIDRLFNICCSPVLKTRGWHPCPFCSSYPVNVQKKEKKLILGAAEIRVIWKNKIYASPDLIYHYVTSHQYRPPREYIDAVLES